MQVAQDLHINRDVIPNWAERPVRNLFFLSSITTAASEEKNQELGKQGRGCSPQGDLLKDLINLSS
jgi:hypothetical protein